MDLTISPLLLLVVFPVLYGITMKIADLLDEHGLKWFNGAPILFGILWGLFGNLLVLFGTTEIASTIIAMNIAFIFRMRIDYKNHAIAVCLILVTFLVFREVNLLIFLSFLINFTVFGTLKDFFGERLAGSGWLHIVFEFGWYYILLLFCYSLWSSDWGFFIVFFLYILSYNLVRYMAEEKFLYD